MSWSHSCVGETCETGEIDLSTPPTSTASRSRLAVSVVIPVRNEAVTIAHVVARIPDWVDEVIIVDGNSTDETVTVVEGLHPAVRLVKQTGDGKGDALGCGFRAARGDVIVAIDGDGSNDPGEIPRFVSAIASGFDFAKGTRFVVGGGSTDITRLRRLGNGVLVFLVNRLFRVRYSDLCYGFNAFRAEHISAIYTHCNGFEVEALMNVNAARAGLRTIEVPSYEWPRLAGVSNLRAAPDGWRVLKTIVASRWGVARRH